jgi:histidine triad (HIT) family protein
MIMAEECTFCRIIAGQIPATIIHSDDRTFAFLDINPANKGHTLVLTRKHYENLNEIPANELGSLFEAVQKISKAIEKGLKAEGYNILMNNKRPAGQIIDHAHIHIIPRFKGDEMQVRLGWAYKKYEQGEDKTISEKIKKHL